MSLEVCATPVKTKQQQQKNSRDEISRLAGWLERYDRPKTNDMHERRK